MVPVVAASTTWWSLIGLVFMVPASQAAAVVGSKRNTGPKLIPALALTGRTELIWALLTAVPMALVGLL
jgi:1,4-dihydroxy-2-naphthoate polyprenyltransferase